MIKKLFFPNKNLVAPHEQKADFVELFFDLVFVYAITMITAMTAHHLDFTHVLQAILVFWLIWWGWTQFTWALNAANTKISEVRLIVLLATAVAFVMASSVQEGFDIGVMWFAIPYIIIRAIGIGLYIRVTSNIQDGQAAVLKFASFSLLGLGAVLIGAFAEPSFRVWWWLATILLDFIAAYFGGREEGWNLKAGHFVERHGLIVIIALGESLIVSASAISAQQRSLDLLIAGGLAVIVTCLLWWSYFSWVHEYMEEKLDELTGSKQSQVARDSFSFIHFPLICGIIGMSIGFEKILGHPHDVLSVPVTWALGGGFILFIGSSALAVWRLGQTILVPRIVIIMVGALGIVFSIGRLPYIALGIIAIGLTVLSFFEWRKCQKLH